MGKSSGGIRNAGKNPRKSKVDENKNSQKVSSENEEIKRRFNNMVDLKTYLDSRNEKALLKKIKVNYTQVQDVKKGDPFNLYELDRFIHLTGNQEIRSVFVTKNRGKYIYRDLQLKDVIKKR